MRAIHVFFKKLIPAPIWRALFILPQQTNTKPAHIRILRGNKAQALTEYILIVAIIALVCMSGAKIFQMGLVNAFRNFITILQIPIP